MEKLFSKTVYDLKNHFRECMTVENDTDIIYTLLPAWEYHVRIVETDELDVFAEFILKLLDAGITDTRKISEVLCLNLELVRHIIKTTLRPYVTDNRVNKAGKMLLQNNYVQLSNNDVYDFIFFVDACNGSVIAVREDNGKEPVRKITDSGVLEIGKRSSSQKLATYPILWSSTGNIEKETIQDYLLSHDLFIAAKDNKVLKNPFAASFSKEGVPVYLLTALTRPRVVTDQYAWIARNPENGMADLQTTETVKEMERNDVGLAEKIKTVLLADVKRTMGSEALRQAEPKIKEKIPFFGDLPTEIQEALLEYQVQWDDAQMAKSNKIPYRQKLNNCQVLLRKILETTIACLNKKYEKAITVDIFKKIQHWNDNSELQERLCNLFETTLQQDIDSCRENIRLNLKQDFYHSMPRSHKLQSAILCAATVACFRRQHSFMKLAMNSAQFLENLLNCIHTLNESAHNLTNNIGWNELAKVERQIIVEWGELMKDAYNIK